MLHSTLRALWFLLAVEGALAWPSNRFRIPNGHRVLCAPGVPDCAGVEAGTVCSAIGHAKCAGGTPAWNRFGLDFRRLGSRWSKELCAIDSDGDGASNGAELGDPCCVYDYDDPATYDLIDTTGPVSHPGSNKSVVPDYVRFPDPKCKPRPVEWATIRTNMQTTEEYDPSFFLKGEEQLVKRFTMQRFEIPVDMKSAKPDTVYEWVSWNWDGCTDKDCYLVGIEMVINNTEMSHHWTISSCDSPPLTDPELDGLPTLTGQAQECVDLVGAWTPGRNPVVKASPESSRQFPKTLAGFNGNVHYNNPELKVGQTDQSSWLLYYTTQPRQYKIGQFFPLVISVAPFIKLDAAKERKFITSGCTLSGLDEPIHAEGIWNHAHLVGTGMYMEVYYQEQPGLPANRYMLQDDPIWSFQDQYSKKINARTRKLQNGDYIQVMCMYNTTDRTEDTTIGPSTHDEMCWHIVQYYPKQENLKCEGPVWTGDADAKTPLVDLRHNFPIPELAYAAPDGSKHAALGQRLVSNICDPDPVNAIEEISFTTLLVLLAQHCKGDVLNPKCLNLLSGVFSCTCHCNPGYDRLTPEVTEFIQSGALDQLNAMLPQLSRVTSQLGECPEVCPAKADVAVFDPSVAVPVPTAAPRATAPPKAAATPVQVMSDGSMRYASLTLMLLLSAGLLMPRPFD